MNTSSQPSSTELNALILLYKTGRYAELESRSQQLTQQHPDAGILWKLLGASLSMQDKDALPTLLKTAELLPEDAETHNNIGNILETREQLDAAVESYRSALTINPELIEAHYNLGNVLHKLGRIADAIASYRNALKINPNFALVHSNLGSTLLEFGLVNEALASCYRALELEPNSVVMRSNFLGTMNHTSHAPFDYLTEALHYGTSVAKKVPARFTAWQCDPQPRRLRVGIVSGDMWNHPVGYFIESLLAQLANSRIELIAYSNNPMEDDLTLRIKPYFSAWKPIYALGDPAAAQLIHADGVHILIDLSGHTSHNRLPVFAWKPAPVQCTWLGLPTTTGVAEIDYVLGDAIATPPEDAAHFSEQIWCLPESYLCLSTPDATLPVNALPALTNGHLTLASFNNLSKMNDATVSLWARILLALPNAVLLLKAKQLKDPSVIRTTLQRFAVHGITAERLILEGQTPRRDNHLATYWRADMALDPFPYPGVTTSVEALWMGVPVLTLQGDRFMSRTAASIAHNAGLPDWIAPSEDDYVAKAVQFARDLPKLAALRHQLREQVRTSPLFDAPRFAKHFEAALWGMWQAKMQKSPQVNSEHAA